LTLHRRESQGEAMRAVCDAVRALAGRGDTEVVFPVHRNPAVREIVMPALAPAAGVHLCEPLDYLALVHVLDSCDFVLTDSGGLQEETSFLGVPCLTVRPNTERPITCTHGTNRLVAPRRDAIVAAAERALARRTPARPVIERWDGRAAERIARAVCDGERFELDGGAAAPPQVVRRAVAVPQPLGAG
jgi:UDP-N-acetylglucosamine 2-epimerase (non-hydrolysing)